MANLDDHIEQQASGLLRDGEQLQAKGHVKSKNPTRDVYIEWLVGVTDQRLLFFPAKQTLTLAIEPTDSPPPFQLELRDVERAWIKPGSVGASNWRRFGMQPLKGRGARDLNGELITDQFKYPVQPQFENRIVLDVPPETKGLDGQQQFHQRMPGWIVENVESRAFWGPEEHAAYEEQQQAEAAEQAAKEEKRAELIATAKRLAPMALPIIGLLMMLPSIYLFMEAYSDVNRMSRYEKDIACADQTIEAYEANRSWLEKGKEPPKGCEKIAKSQSGCASKVRWGEFGFCRACRVGFKKPRSAQLTGRKLYKRGKEYWNCPADTAPLDRSIQRLKDEQDDLRDDIEEERVELIIHLVLGLLFLLGGLVLVGLGGFLFFRAKKASA